MEDHKLTIREDLYNYNRKFGRLLERIENESETNQKLFRKFNDQLIRIFHICGDRLIDHATFTVVEAHAYPYRFLFQKEDEHKPAYIGSSPGRKLDKDDYRILQYISNNARVRVLDISEALKIEPKKISYRIKTMKEFGYIASFTTLLDVSKLGYNWHYVFFKLNYSDEKKGNDFLKYLKSLPWTYYLIKGVGNYNLTAEIHAKDAKHYQEILNDIKEKYRDVIKKIWMFQITEEHKCDFFPARILDEVENGQSN